MVNKNILFGLGSFFGIMGISGLIVSIKANAITNWFIFIGSAFFTGVGFAIIKYCVEDD